MPLAHRPMLAGLVLAAALAGCASPPPDVPPVQRLDAVLRAATSGHTVTLRLSSSEIRTGQTLGAQVESSLGGYLYLFQLGTEGKAFTMIFPNAVDGANHLAPGQPLVLPRRDWRMSARGPAGVGYLMAVVTQQAQDLLALQAQVQAGNLQPVGPYGAALAPLREVAP